MLLSINNKNLCAKLSCLCISIISAILTVDYVYELTPFNFIALFLYVLFVLFTTIWVCFVYFQRILNNKIPIKISECKLLTKISEKLTVSKSKNEKLEKTINERINEFVTDIDNMFVRKWFIQYISHDEKFLEESKTLVDLLTRRFIQVSPYMNSDKILHGCLNILLKHVKEYRKAVRKASKHGGSVESTYRYSHIGSKDVKTFENFILQLTMKQLRYFINWELYNSLACRCLVQILARKLVATLLIYFSSPGFINYKIFITCVKEEIKTELNLIKYSFISISDVDLSIDLEKDEIIKELDKKEDEEVKDEIGCLTKTILSDVIEEDILEMAKEETVISTTPIKSTNDKIISENVKIYESRETNKTWRNSRDLDCISLGQDTLFLSNLTDSSKITPLKKSSKQLAEIQEFKIISKKQVHEEASISRNNFTNLLLPSTTGAATLITNTIRPIGDATAHTMKEIQQSTVNNVVKPMSQATSNAIHKIGDFQDEAAGVVEGIFDFGMAGLRKGLRLTGLQDNFPENLQGSYKHKTDRREDYNKRMIEVESTKIDWVDSTSPSFDGEILLEQSPLKELTKTDIPIMEIICADTPELEYEDETDLATTTAKLRTLLAQRISESSLNTPVTPMSIIPTPGDEDISEGDGGLPSMFKVWTKTTGVFQNTLNTIKTALPGNTNECMEVPTTVINPDSFETDKSRWKFIENDESLDFIANIEKLLLERRDFCTVDNADEATELGDQVDSTVFLPRRQIEDELDEFDSELPMTKALIDLICEILEDTYPLAVKENIIRVIMLVSGKFIEQQVHNIGIKLIKAIPSFIGKIPKFSSSPKPMAMTMEDFTNACINIIPESLVKILNEEDVKIILTLLFESFQSQKINQDTNLQVLELFVMEIISATSQTSPAYSA